MDLGTPKRAEFFAYGLIVLVILIVLFVILKRFGLIKFKTRAEKDAAKTKKETKAETKIIETTINRSELFSPVLWQQANKANLLPDAKGRELSAELRKHMKGLGTDETGINGIFRSLTHKLQVSQLAFFYQSQFGRDLASDLMKELSKSELQVMYEIIESI